jgi:hypothetical protein
MRNQRFSKDLFKLLNNSLFGKFCENLLKRIDVKLVSEQIQAERLIVQPAFEDFQIINDDVTVVKSRVTKLTWNKPTQVGFSILELSKLHLYRFYYEHICPGTAPTQSSSSPIQTASAMKSPLQTSTPT